MAGSGSDSVFDTIIAPATPSGRSAIAVVRIDGPLSPNILLKLANVVPKPREATHVSLRDRSGSLIDDAVVVLFTAPASFTGNDTVEISIHGNRGLTERLIAEALQLGARLAEAGEFAERAVLNGKMDLIQAEAIVGLIDSRTAAGAALALSHLGGSFSRASEEIRGELLELLTLVEGALDFADEGYEFIARERLGERLGSLSAELERLLGTFRRGRALTDGIQLVLLGQPNAGKSTLLNRLVGNERAIVTDQPGTTRDLLRETIVLAGVPVTVTDTAGLRESTDEIEEIGMRRARGAAGEADLVLYLIDSARGLDEADRVELEAFEGAIPVYTKTDLAPPPVDQIGFSAVSPGGIDGILEVLSSLVQARFDLEQEGPAVTNLRQYLAIEAGLDAVRAARISADSGDSEEFVAADLYRAATALAALTGGIRAEDARRQIFARFCIGK